MRSVPALLALLTALAPGLPAHARNVDDAVAEATVALRGEIMLLVELGAFSNPIPDELLAIRHEWRRHMEGMQRTQLLAWLGERDQAGEAAGIDLVSFGVELGRSASSALAPIPRAALDAMASGAAEIVDPRPYASAIRNLELHGAQSPAAGSSSHDPSPEPGEQSDGSGEIDPPIEATAGSLVWVGLGVAASLLAGTLAGLRRRIGARSPSSDRLLEAGRRMQRAFDADEIARIARVEAMALARAPLGAYVDVEGHSLEPIVDPDQVFDRQRLADGLLRRVADTGEAVSCVTWDEPSIADLPAALLAVPVTDGRLVRGIIALVRLGDQPFSPQDAAGVLRLAPMVAAAEVAARRHDSMTDGGFTDDLTGLPNRRSFDQDLGVVFGSASGGPVTAVAMIDVDHLGLYNARNGHVAGDCALEHVAGALVRSTRPGGRVYRFGDGLFALLMRADSRHEVIETVERARRQVESSSMLGAALQPGGSLTISAGLAVVRHASVDTALAAADAALYMAKSRGGNRIEWADDRSAFDVPAPTPPVEDDRRPA